MHTEVKLSRVYSRRFDVLRSPAPQKTQARSSPAYTGHKKRATPRVNPVRFLVNEGK